MMDKETERLLKEKLINDKKKERNLKIIIVVCGVIMLILPFLGK